MRIVDQVLRQEENNHIQPFLWVHGEAEEILRSEIRKINECHIKSLCVEARPHDDFNGDGWFRDLGIILDECKALGMTMWVLDDSHFPTGYADGAVKKYHPEYRKQFLYCKVMDFAGPIEHSGAILKYLMRTPQDQVVSLRLYRKTAFETINVNDSLDLTDSIEWHEDYDTGKPVTDFMGHPVGDMKHGKCPSVRFDLLEGEWSLILVASSYKGGEKQTADYLNPLRKEATDVLLSTVYEPIYEHLGNEFGSAFRGFFSDEPRFGNIHGSEDASIGRNSQMDLPWCDDLLDQLTKELQNTDLKEKDAVQLLPLLFINGVEDRDQNMIRYAYMNLVSRLYSENFDGEIASWCHAHHCEHIGHTIEDNNATARLGYGAGHYFRAVKHQDMAGIDVVIQQLLPGQNHGLFKGMHKPGWDGEFFTYVLGKLGSSEAHLNPQHHNRCMCELFGAYGWAEGNKLCKWQADYMLVRGVNEFVPHAFDPAPFPDADCPPHFYAHGNNPQYREFGILMKYLNRMSEMLSGTEVSTVALLYHGEAEWSGEYMLSQKPAALLADHQIDYQIVPADYFQNALLKNGALEINSNQFKTIIVPEAEALPYKLLEKLGEYAQAGFPVYFINHKPTVASEQTELPDLGACSTVNLDHLIDELKSHSLFELSCDTPAPYLRYYHARQADGDVYFFVNEGLSQINTGITGINADHIYVYDPFENKLTREEHPCLLHLEPYESKCLVVPNAEYQQIGLITSAAHEEIDLNPDTVTLKDVFGNSCSSIALKEWKPIDLIEGYESFAGRIDYTVHITLTDQQAGSKARLSIQHAGEAVSVSVNGNDYGTKICGPYVFELSDALHVGENEIVLSANTTLGRRMNDFLSQFMPIAPEGIYGCVTLRLF